MGLGLDPAVPSRAFSRLSFPRPSGDGHIAAVLFVLGWVGVVVCSTSPLGLAWRVVRCSGLGEGRASRSLSWGDTSLFPPAALGAARSSGAARGDGETASLKSGINRYDRCTRGSAGDPVRAEPRGAPVSLHPPGSSSDLPRTPLRGARLARQLSERCFQCLLLGSIIIALLGPSLATSCHAEGQRWRSPREVPALPVGLSVLQRGAATGAWHSGQGWAGICRVCISVLEGAGLLHICFY